MSMGNITEKLQVINGKYHWTISSYQWEISDIHENINGKYQLSMGNIII